MWIDNQLNFSSAQAVTATALSTNVIDTTLARDIGNGSVPLYLVVQVTESFATATSVTFTLESSAAAGITSATVHFSTGAVAIASLTAGIQAVVVPIPSGTYLRYLGVRYTIGGSSATAGIVDAFLTPNPQRYKAYATGTTV